RPPFIGIGLISLAWIPAWIKWMPRGRAVHRTLDVAAPGFVDILRQRSFWGVCAGHFSIIYLLYFMLTWLPFYLIRERHLSMQSMVKVATAYLPNGCAIRSGDRLARRLLHSDGPFAVASTQVCHGAWTPNRKSCTPVLRARELSLVFTVSAHYRDR